MTATTITVVGYYPAADTSACLYDSGAPYFTTPKRAAPLLVSVESNGPDCPHTSPETTARADTITKWIKTIVPDLPCSNRRATPTQTRPASHPAGVSDGSESGWRSSCCSDG